MKKNIYLFIIMLMITLVGCVGKDKQQQNGAVENKVETEETEKKDNHEHSDNEFHYGTYSDGEFGELLIKENGYASVTRNYTAGYAGPQGKYEYKDGMIYIVENGVVTAELKEIDGNFSLLKYCVGGVFYELEEGEVIYYFATEEIGYDKIPQEFYESINK